METQSPPRNTPTASIVSALCLSFLLLSTTAPSLAAAASAKGKLHMAIVAEATGAPIPARVHLKDASGAEIKTAAYPYHKGHFTCPGFFELSLPAGEYRYEAEHGQIAATIPFENWKKMVRSGRFRSMNPAGSSFAQSRTIPSPFALPRPRRFTWSSAKNAAASAKPPRNSFSTGF
ncbi:MAG: hypothetical protein ACI8QF_003770, partial [Limisphaerales bacterium]